MQRRCGRSFAVVLALAGGCSLSSLDDLQGGPTDAGGRCEEKVDCSGCQGCAKLCTCTAAPDFDQCYQSCLQTADAGPDAGGSSGTSGSAGQGGVGGAGAVGGSSANGGTGATGATGGGDNGGSAGSGGSGAVGGTGGGTSGNGGMGGSSGTGGGGVCTSPTGDACQDCVQDNCCPELEACEANLQCYDFAMCFSTYCTSDPTQACAMMHCQSVYGGFADYAALNNCAFTACSNECGLP